MQKEGPAGDFFRKRQFVFRAERLRWPREVKKSRLLRRWLSAS